MIREELSVREGHIVRVLEVLGGDIVGGKKVTTVGNVTVPELKLEVVTFPILKMPKNCFFTGLTVIAIILSIAGLYLVLITGVVYLLIAKIYINLLVFTWLMNDSNWKARNKLN